MLQQARMASLGQTAAGVAHEINNPLAFVTNNLVILQREVSGLHDLLRLYQQAEQTLAVTSATCMQGSPISPRRSTSHSCSRTSTACSSDPAGLLRIQKIVADLSDFAHLEEAEFKEADLNAGIGTTVRLMQSLADLRQVIAGDQPGPGPTDDLFSGEDQPGGPEPDLQCDRRLSGRRKGLDRDTLRRGHNRNRRFG